MKACLFNLIIFTDESKQLGYLNEIAATLVTKYPSRIILIHSNDSIHDIHIEKKSLGPLLYDQVIVHLPKTLLDSISLFVLPYLIPDFPNCLFYSGNPVKESPVFNTLIRLSNRLIVDSETSDNLCGFCTTILDQITKYKVDVIDFNWARTQGWRLIISNLFDNEEKLRNLALSKKVKVEYYQSTHSLNPTLYLQAWLASRLHWEYIGHQGTSEIYYRHEKNSLTVQLIRSKENFTDEPISKIELTTQDDMSYTVILQKDQPQALVHICSGETCALPYTQYFPNFQRGTSYFSQLIYGATSKQYCDILPLLKKFYA